MDYFIFFLVFGALFSGDLILKAINYKRNKNTYNNGNKRN